MKSTAASRYTLDRLPRFADIEPASLVESLGAMLDDHRARIEALTGDPASATWDSVIAPMEALSDELQRFFGPVSHLHNVADSDALRAPYNECIGLISAYSSELAQHAGLYACYRHIRDSAAFADFGPARQRVIDNALRDFHLGGVDLPPARQAEVRALKVELSQLHTRFEEHVLDATQAFRLHVDDEAALAGLPPSVLGLARQNAAAEDRAGWTLTLDFPCYQPAITRLEDRALRRTLYEAYVTRASERGPQAGQFDNGPVMNAILDKRQALAGALGFANYAELSLATKMAPSTAAVVDFLRELAAKARPAALRELQELGEFARSELGLDTLEAWDMGYAAEKYREHRFQLSQEELKPYFPIARVLPGMLEVAARLFGVRFERVEGIESWHEDVVFHAIVDADDTPVGFFFLDLYARARKRPGAWMDECLVSWQHAEQCQLPVAYLTCNFTPPVAGQPTLLTHDEVSTLFHEFGHGLHHMLTRVRRPAVAGINGVPWDAVELPSQFLENWCWEREALDLFSGHHATGEVLPPELFERLEASRHYHAALQMLRQVEFALFDFRLHMDYVPGFDIQGLLDAVRAEVAVVTPPPWNRFQHSFAHIFAGGYAAGYYSYKWAEVLAADAYARFEEEGVFNPETGRAFRQSILENGGAEDAMALFKRFRGREPSVEPLLRHAGLHA
ncbi:MAG: M3 family metallopeptidase [Gammaproteobacteria bacterium]|nr:M3 family metallopeptidase [Gammaproteobacteria bacterium]